MNNRRVFDIFNAVHEGNTDPLIELIESGAEVTDEHRKLIGKILRDGVRRPPHRQKSEATSKRRSAIAKRVMELVRGGMKQMAAIAQAKAEFKCSERTVKTALQFERELEEMQNDFRGAADRLANSGDAGRFMLRRLIIRIQHRIEDEIGMKKKWFPPAIFEGEIK